MLTKFFAKLLGPWTSLVVLGADPALLFVVGAFTVLVGLAVVIAHNRWSGGPLAIVVTLYGWLMLIRGLTYVSLSPSMRSFELSKSAR
jgi:hypothetical protein